MGKRGGNIWEISIPSTQFCCGLKTTLKNNNKVYIYIYFLRFSRHIFWLDLALRSGMHSHNTGRRYYLHNKD